MKALLEALVAKWQTDLSGTFGRLYADLVPEGTARPYARYMTLNNSDLKTFDGPIETTVIQIEAWAVGHNVTCGHRDTIKRVLDGVVLTLGVGTQKCIKFECRRAPVVWSGRDENNDDVYRVVMEFVAEVDHTG